MNRKERIIAQCLSSQAQQRPASKSVVERAASYEGPPTILNEGKAEDVSIKMILISNNMYSIDSNLLHIKQLNFAVSAGRS